MSLELGVATHKTQQNVQQSRKNLFAVNRQNKFIFIHCCKFLIKPILLSANVMFYLQV